MSRTSRMHAGILTLAAGAALPAGCASAPPLQEQAVSKPLAPMPRPERAVGYKAVRLRDGREEVITLMAQTDQTQTWADSSGCQVVLLRTGFAPALEFTNCDGGTGTQAVKLMRGSPYPLTAGSKWVYSYDGTNVRGDRWTGQRHCEVRGTARVKAGAAEHDVYKVLCEDNAGNTRTTYTYYVSPELQTTILQERYRVRNWQGAPPPDRTTWQFVRQE